MKKSEYLKNLVILFAVVAFQTSVFAAQPQQPQMKPKVQVQQINVNTSLQSQSNTMSSKAVSTTTDSKFGVPPKEARPDFETYKDSEGNPISKEQKERSSRLKKTYKGVTRDEHLMEAMELMKGGLGDFSRRAILGNNLSGKPMQVDFEDLSKFGQAYANFDALGWNKKGRLYIYINKKHQDAPKPALAAVLAHEALHQDDFNSLNEETYAWTLEAAVWTQLSEKDPRYNDSIHPLVVRENTLKKLFIRGNYTSKYIRKTVYSNAGYANLPSRSPGFEDDSL